MVCRQHADIPTFRSLVLKSISSPPLLLCLAHPRWRNKRWTAPRPPPPAPRKPARLRRGALAPDRTPTCAATSRGWADLQARDGWTSTATPSSVRRPRARPVNMQGRPAAHAAAWAAPSRRSWSRRTGAPGFRWTSWSPALGQRLPGPSRLTARPERPGDCRQHQHHPQGRAARGPEGSTPGA